MRTLVLVFVSVSLVIASFQMVNSQEDDECLFGPTSQEESIADLRELEAEHDLFSPAEEEEYFQGLTDTLDDKKRQEEIREYIEDNEEMPDYLDEKTFVCLIAGNIQEKEDIQALIYDEEQIHDQFRVELIKLQAEVIEKELEFRNTGQIK